MPNLQNQPNQSNKKNLCITVNTLCNWDCPYCISETNLSSTSFKKERSEERLFLKALETLKSINPNDYSSITLSGGEPGLLPLPKLLELLQVGYNRGFNIDINSNGKILKSIFYYINQYNTWKDSPNFLSEEINRTIKTLKTIDTIDIHLFPTIDQGINVLKSGPLVYNIGKFKYSFQTLFKLFKDFGIKIRPLMVIGKSDLDNLEKFILAFTDTFNPVLNGFELELRVCVDNESNTNKEKLSKMEILNVIRTIYQYKIVSHESMYIAETILDSLKLNRYS